MLKGKTVDRICCLAAAFMLVASTLLWGVVEAVQGDGSHTIGYEDKLFDQSYVHTIEIEMTDWDSFIENATAEEYTDCNITIDGEAYNHVAIRCKGNTSLSSVEMMGSSRYSFKVEFDHYVSGMTYYGLDKISLNNLIQDATMMKDYLAYTLMNRMGVPSSLCSYVQINVNGEPWGLYLAVEGVEDAFLERNGMTKGKLYKPDSVSFGGGKGNGRDFDFEQFRISDDEDADSDEQNATSGTQSEVSQMPDRGGGFGMPQGGPGGHGGPGGFPGMPDSDAFADFDPDSFDPESFDPSQMGPSGGGMGGFDFGMGSNDVKLIYTDDEIDSYSNIFENAKRKIKKRDKLRLIESLRKLNALEDIEDVVNEEEVLRYLVVHNFVCNDDSYTGQMVHNYYLYEEDGQLSILPWDYNLAFGGFSGGTDATSTVNSPIDSPVSGGNTSDRPLVAWVFENEDAVARYHELYSEFIQNTIESGWLAEEIERVKEMITPYLEADESKFYTMDEFETAVETLQVFCEKRAESISGQLDGTIPSTTAGQAEDASALIDASEISITDMGSMNVGGEDHGGGGPSMGGGMPGMPSMGFGSTSGSTGFPGGYDGNQTAGVSTDGQTSDTKVSESSAPEKSITGDENEGKPEVPDSQESSAKISAPVVEDDETASGEQTEFRPSQEQFDRSSGGGPGFGGGMPGEFPFEEEQGLSLKDQLLQYGIYAVLLIAALIAVIRFKGHNS